LKDYVSVLKTNLISNSHFKSITEIKRLVKAVNGDQLQHLKTQTYVIYIS